MQTQPHINSATNLAPRFSQSENVARTMSSREISKLTGKAHKHVLADIRSMLKELEIDWADCSAQYQDSTGRSLPCFELNRELTDTLLTGYSAKMRLAVIRRWRELEQQQGAREHVQLTGTKVIGEIAIMECFTRLLKPAASCQMAMLTKIAQNNGLDPKFLPGYAVDAAPDAAGGSSMPTKAITALIKDHSIWGTQRSGAPLFYQPPHQRAQVIQHAGGSEADSQLLGCFALGHLQEVVNRVRFPHNGRRARVSTYFQPLRLLAVCEVFPALEFLAMSADEQREAIPDCPACEAWSMTMLPLDETLAACGNAIPSEIGRGLKNLWQLCNGLSEEAFHCGDRLIFDHQDWRLIRDSATDLLGLMGHLEVSPFLSDLTVDCQNEVNGYVAAKPERS